MPAGVVFTAEVPGDPMIAAVLRVVVLCAAGAAATWASARYVCDADATDRRRLTGGTANAPVVAAGPSPTSEEHPTSTHLEHIHGGSVPPDSSAMLDLLDGVRVLVLDDEADSAGLLASMLAPFGARVMATTSAREALEIVYRQPVDVVVCDVWKEHRGWFALVRQLRTLGGSRGIPAVGIGEWSPRKVGTAMFGFRRQIAKPVSALELAHVVAELVNQGRDA